MGSTDTLEFTTGDDVETCALFAQEAENRERGVSFDRVADGVRAVVEGLGEEAETIQNLLG